MRDCEHRRIKKNYPFGHRSTPRMFCKDCGIVIKPIDIKKRRPKKRRQKVKEARTKKKE